MTRNPIMQDDGQFHELSDLLHDLEPVRIVVNQLRPDITEDDLLAVRMWTDKRRAGL